MENKKVKLTKLSDDHFNGNHPNSIYKGFNKIGIINELPKINERFYLDSFNTSPVIEELNEEGIFKTTYSTYKLEYLE